MNECSDLEYLQSFLDGLPESKKNRLISLINKLQIEEERRNTFQKEFWKEANNLISS